MIRFKETNMNRFLKGIERKYVKYVERLPYINWFNPIITFYLNLRSFPLNQAVRFPVFVYGWPKLFSLYGTMECQGKCIMGMIKFNQTNPEAPSNPGSNTALANWGKIIFHGECLIYTSNKINVSRHGILEFGERTMVMHHCNIAAYSKVEIGNQSWITHRCQVMDTNFHYIADFNNKVIEKIARPIKIGAYCWICNTTTICAGSVIPDKTIVASNSLVNKDMSNIPEETIIGGIPAKIISTGVRKVDNISLIKKLQVFFMQNPEEAIFKLDKNISHSICNIVNSNR